MGDLHAKVRPRVDESNLLFSAIWIITFSCQIVGEVYPKIFSGGHRVYAYPANLARQINSLTMLTQALWNYVDQSPPRLWLHLSDSDFGKMERLALVCKEFGHLIQMVIVHQFFSPAQARSLKQRIVSLHQAIDGLVAIYLEELEED